MERKATDILLELEAAIQRIEGYCKNLDFTNKIILEKLNAKPAPDRRAFDGLPLAPAKEPDKALTVESTPAPKKEEHKQPSLLKIPVQQKIVYDDGRNVVLAHVEIVDSKGNSVKKTRTNSAGKWNALLEPGNYAITVVKAATDNKKQPVEKRYSVDIPQSEFPMELDNLRV